MFTQDNLCLKNAYNFIYQNKTNPIPVIFDVGFNRGEFLADAYSVLGSELEFFAFEPNKNAKDPNIENVYFFNMALGDTEKKGTLYVPYEFKEKDNVSRCASLYNRPAFEKMTNYELQTMDIEITTLDIFVQKHLIQHIDYLKIDTEGYELNVLKGAENMFRLDKISAGQFEYGDCFKEQNYTIEDVVFWLNFNNFTCFLGEIQKENILFVENASAVIKQKSIDLWENILFVNNKILDL